MPTEVEYSDPTAYSSPKSKDVHDYVLDAVKSYTAMHDGAGAHKVTIMYV